MTREDVVQLLRSVVDRTAVIEINNLQLRLSRVTSRQKRLHFCRYRVDADILPQRVHDVRVQIRHPDGRWRYAFHRELFTRSSISGV